MDWQTIDTAPMDGTHILVWHSLWKVPIPVYFDSDCIGSFPWVSALLNNAWTDNAFAHWTPIIPPTQKAPR